MDSPELRDSFCSVIRNFVVRLPFWVSHAAALVNFRGASRSLRWKLLLHLTRRLTHFNVLYRWRWLVCYSLFSWSLQKPYFQSGLARYLANLIFLPPPKKPCPRFHFLNQELNLLHRMLNHLLRNHLQHSVAHTTVLNFTKWSKTPQATRCDVILSCIAGSPPLLLVRFWLDPDLSVLYYKSEGITKKGVLAPFLFALSRNYR